MKHTRHPSDVYLKRFAGDFLKNLKKQIDNIPERNTTETLGDFSERVRIVSSGLSARPGKYRFSTTPYMREIADNLSVTSPITRTALIKPTQIGGTEIPINLIQYCAYYGLGPGQYITGDDILAESFKNNRFDKAMRDSGLRHLITPPVIKKSNSGSGDTKRTLSFGGTFFTFSGSQSENRLSSNPIRILIRDEIDKYPTTLRGGGISVQKAERRTDTYRNLKKIFDLSTPKKKATSQIEPIVRLGDMRDYKYVCPGCGRLQALSWKRIKWDKKKNGMINIKFDEAGNLKNNPVWHKCLNQKCKYKLKDFEKESVLQELGHGGTARWVPSKTTEIPNMRSYRLNGLYGFRRWTDIVLEWQAAQEDPALLQDFINDVLAETFTEKIDKPDEHYLQARAENDWRLGQINEKIKLLTLGVDVQKNRIEYIITGWTDRKESWVVDYKVVPGNPFETNNRCWARLEEAVRKEYKTKKGRILKPQIVMIDAPYANASVLDFCAKFPKPQNSHTGIFPAIGKQELSGITKRNNNGEIILHDQRLKREIYDYLKRQPPASGIDYPYGFIHFPGDLGPEFYKQLTAEEVTEVIGARGQKSLIIHNPHQRRNEVLDCFKLSLAGVYYMFTTFFENWNQSLKERKHKEIEYTWPDFWGLFGKIEMEEIEEKKKKGAKKKK